MAAHRAGTFTSSCPGRPSRREPFLRPRASVLPKVQWGPPRNRLTLLKGALPSAGIIATQADTALAWPLLLVSPPRDERSSNLVSVDEGYGPERLFTRREMCSRGLVTARSHPVTNEQGILKLRYPTRARWPVSTVANCRASHEPDTRVT